MEPTFWSPSPSRSFFYSLVLAIVVVVALLVVPAFLASNTWPGAATYSHGVLHVAIPYQDAKPGAGRLRGST